MRFIKKVIFGLFIVINVQSISGQEVRLDGEIFEYATYYISSFDLNTGATNVQIFRYQLSTDAYPVQVKIRFKASILSPILGINSNLTIMEVETDPFPFVPPTWIDSKVLWGLLKCLDKVKILLNPGLIAFWPDFW